MPTLPTGTVTFLFTDIEGNTALWEQDHAAMREAVARQLAILHSLIEAHHGVLYKTIGDGTQAAFASAEDAVRAAVAAQRALLQETWANLPGPLRVRMALHLGEAAPDERGDYLAASLHRLVRLLAIGHGGQILLTQAVQQLTRGALPAQVTLRDLGEHRLRDLLEPERVFQLVHPDLPAEFPPLQSLEARATNLPHQPTPFLGREQQVSDVVAELRREHVQLLTLTGPGGTGKTRLALQAAAELLDDFSDGVFFVPLASLNDPAQVPSALAAAIGVRDDGGQPLPDRLAAFLLSKQMLLLIDNWEHLLDAAPFLGELLRSAPRLTVLATSRAPLHLQAEREYPVPPLALPRRKPPPTLEQLSQYEAVRLFIARAQAVKPDFAIDNANAPAVAEICHRLDGLPLAIELAAARLRLLPPQSLLDRLEKRLPVLAGGARDAPTRQKTLRQTIAWSHDLLSGEEQLLFRRLAVFTGGFSFEAAEAVANPGEDIDVWTGLSALVDHSLVQQAEDTSGEPRFTMLETIREFAVECLHLDSAEKAAVSQAHAHWFLSLATAVGDDIRLKGHPPGLNRLISEYDNVRTALVWFADRNDSEPLARLSEVLTWFWQQTTYGREGEAWLERVLQLSIGASPVARMKLLFGAGVMMAHRDDHVRARTLGGELLALAQAEHERESEANALFLLSRVANQREDHAEAKELAEEAVRLFRELSNPAWMPWTLQRLGVEVYIAGEYGQAAALFEEALADFRAISSVIGVAYALSNLGLTWHRAGDRHQAVAFYRESLVLHRELAVPIETADLFGQIAFLFAELGHAEPAARLLGAAEGLYEDSGTKAQPYSRDILGPAQAAAEAQLGPALFAVARAAGRQLTVPQAIEEAVAIMTALERE